MIPPFLPCAVVTAMRTTRSAHNNKHNNNAYNALGVPYNYEKNLLHDDSAVFTTMNTKNLLHDYKNVLLKTVLLIICAVVTAMSTKNYLND